MTRATTVPFFMDEIGHGGDLPGRMIDSAFNASPERGQTLAGSVCVSRLRKAGVISPQRVALKNDFAIKSHVFPVCSACMADSWV